MVSEFVTLDGVMQDPGGSEKDSFPSGGWAFRFERGPEGDAFKLEELMAADALLLGRTTYEGFAAAWPAMEESTGEFGRKMNAMPKLVVSSTLTEGAWRNTTILSGELATEVEAAKARFEGDLLVAGSAWLVQGLLAAGLVDELRLMVFPTVLGAGKKLFGELAPPRDFALAETGRAGETVTMVLRRA